MSDNIPKVNVAELLADRDKLRGILHSNGFVRCDVPACNCDSWHPQGGFYARFREIEEVVGGHSGKPLLKTVSEMVDELADLRAYKERTEAELRIRCHHLSVYEMAGDAAQRVFARSEIDEYKVAGLWRDPPAEGEVKP